MHNKRIGRDDLLKIEASAFLACKYQGRLLMVNSGLVPPRLPPGALTLALAVMLAPAVVIALLVGDAAHLRRVADEEITRRARMIAVTATMRDVTVTAIDLAARMIASKNVTPTETVTAIEK